MSPARHRIPAFRHARGALAGLLALLVFTLGLLAVSPEAHALLHSGAHSGAALSLTHAHPADASAHDPHATHDDLGCAVTLFSHGVTTPLALPHLDAPRITLLATLAGAPDTFHPSAPPHRLQPARGPPRLG